MTAATPRLLLVDDESSITDGLAPFLARSGFEVRVACSVFGASPIAGRDVPEHAAGFKLW